MSLSLVLLSLLALVFSAAVDAAPTAPKQDAVAIGAENLEPAELTETSGEGEEIEMDDQLVEDKERINKYINTIQALLQEMNLARKHSK